MQSKHRKRVPRIRTITLHNRHHCYRFLHHRLFSSLPRRFIAISTRGRQWRDPRSLPETIRVFRSQINSLSRLWSHPRGAAGSQGDDDSRLDHGGGKSTMTTLRAHTRTVTPGGRNYTRNYPGIHPSNPAESRDNSATTNCRVHQRLLLRSSLNLRPWRLWCLVSLALPLSRQPFFSNLGTFF